MKFLLIFLWSLIFCFNVQAGNKNFSGFILFGSPNTNNLAPISEKYKDKTPRINLDNGNDLTIIIYSHGTTRPHKKENCTKSKNKIPSSLRILKKFDNTYFYYLCSKAIDGGVLGSYIDKRRLEINKVLDQLISTGVKSENIFLAGYSAGGWASLMMMNQVEKKFNSAIVFAPAFAGPRSEINKYPRWRKVERPRQVKEMIKARIIKTLIFAYEDDTFNRPQELNFLKEKYPNSVELISYKCGKGHFTVHKDCKLNKTKKIIKNYFVNQK
jgi:hypothetical protein